MKDTIVAISTSYGVSAISITRLSGNLALSIAKQITKKNSFTPRYANLYNLYFQDGKKLDEAIVIYFQAPKSFNGEDIIEFQSHGGIAIANLILELCIYYGARIAENGEFSKRALLNNKISIDKLETISLMIESKNKKSIQLLAKNLSGNLQTFFDTIRKSLVSLLAHSEVSIDYGEEDLPKELISNISNKINDITHKLDKILQNSIYMRKEIEGSSIAIIGKPNVGKSSLLNTILGKNRAIISDQAGTTRDTIEELLEINTHLVKIIDTAGIREKTNDTIESIGIERSLESIQKADIIFAIFDSSNKLDSNDIKVLERLKGKEDKSIIILNKEDLSSDIDRYLHQKEFKLFRYFAKISAKNANISELVQILDEILAKDNLSNEIALSSKRQENLINESKILLMEATKNIENEDLEIFSYNIGEALELISQVTNSYEHSELLDTMFGEFCLGK